MSNKPTPKWITELASELLKLVPGVSRGGPHYSAIVGNWTDIITRHAPSYDDLLAALELAEDLLSHDLGAGSEDFEQIRAAIANAKGQS